MASQDNDAYECVYGGCQYYTPWPICGPVAFKKLPRLNYLVASDIASDLPVLTAEQETYCRGLHSYQSSFWTHIPKIAIVSYILNKPQNCIGDYAGLHIEAPDTDPRILAHPTEGPEQGPRLQARGDFASSFVA